MTRAEAIEILKQLRLDYVEFWEETNNQYVKAYNMAIASLETDEAYQLEVDCIDRNSIKYYPGQGGYMYASKGEIDKLPSVTPQEHRKGQWIESDYLKHRWYCSECGGMHNDPESGEWREVFEFKYDYCPLCGADMRGEE